MGSGPATSSRGARSRPWGSSPLPLPQPPVSPRSSHTNCILSASARSLETRTRCSHLVSPAFTDSLEAVTPGGINRAFHPNKMLTGESPAALGGPLLTPRRQLGGCWGVSVVPTTHTHSPVPLAARPAPARGLLLSRTSVCHCFGLFITFLFIYLFSATFYLKSLVILLCGGL